MRRRLTHLIAAAEPSKFLTLTCNPARHPGPWHGFDVLNRAFPRLIKRLRRYHGDAEVEYLAVWELTKRGWPHVHVALRAPFTPRPLLAKWWRDLTGARIVDIRATTSGPEAALELAKYLTKDMQAPPRVRRFRASAHFLTEPMRPPADPHRDRAAWRVEEDSTTELAARWRARFQAVITLPDETIVAIDWSMVTASTPAHLLDTLRDRAPPEGLVNSTVWTALRLALNDLPASPPSRSKPERAPVLSSPLPARRPRQ